MLCALWSFVGVLGKEATGCISSGETVLGHLEKVDEMPIVHDGDFVLIHFRHLPW